MVDVGITGTGGSGKSSLTDELIARLRRDQSDGVRVVVLSRDRRQARYQFDDKAIVVDSLADIPDEMRIDAPHDARATRSCQPIRSCPHGRSTYRWMECDNR